MISADRRAKNNEKSKRWAAANPEKVKTYQDEYNRTRRPEARRRYRLKSRYNLTEQEHQKMFADQGSACAICKSIEPAGTGNWATDHCHKSGLVRGILCNACNLALGLIKDNQETLQAMICYLRR